MTSAQKMSINDVFALYLKTKLGKDHFDELAEIIVTPQRRPVKLG